MREIKNYDKSRLFAWFAVRKTSAKSSDIKADDFVEFVRWSVFQHRIKCWSFWATFAARDSMVFVDLHKHIISASDSVFDSD